MIPAPACAPDASPSGRAHACRQPLLLIRDASGYCASSALANNTHTNISSDGMHPCIFFRPFDFQVRYHSLLLRRHRQVVLYEGSKGRKNEERGRALFAFWLWEGACRQRSELSGSSCFCMRLFLGKSGHREFKGREGWVLGLYNESRFNDILIWCLLFS